MTSFKISKAIILHLLLLFFSPPLLHKLVGADEKQIQIECHNAEVPTTCMQCLKSNRHAKNSDKVGIATIVVHCLKRHAKILAANMSDLASGSKDEAVKKVFRECGLGYSSTKKKLSAATIRLKNGKYDDAERFVNEALEYELKCHSQIATYEEQIPGNVVYEMRVYEELSEAANRIIERL